MLASDCRTPSLQAFAVYKAVHFVSDTFSRYTDSVFDPHTWLVSRCHDFLEQTKRQEVLLIVFDPVAKWGDLHTLRQRVAAEVRR